MGLLANPLRKSFAFCSVLIQPPQTWEEIALPCLSCMDLNTFQSVLEHFKHESISILLCWFYRYFIPSKSKNRTINDGLMTHTHIPPTNCHNGVVYALLIAAVDDIQMIFINSSLVAVL